MHFAPLAEGRTRGHARKMTSSFVGPELVRYLAQANPPLHPTLERCHTETSEHEFARMKISAEQGAFHQWLLRLLGATRVFEVGVFTGYSSLAAALVLREQQKAGQTVHLLALDVNELWADKAREYYREAGVEDIVELVIGPARTSLEERLAAGASRSYDFGFIDADKTGYADYYELGLRLLRPGGVLAIDNLLWSGRVADSTDTTEDTVALRALAERVRKDERVDTILTTVGDGLLLCRKL